MYNRINHFHLHRKHTSKMDINWGLTERKFIQCICFFTLQSRFVVLRLFISVHISLAIFLYLKKTFVWHELLAKILFLCDCFHCCCWCRGNETRHPPIPIFCVCLKSALLSKLALIMKYREGWGKKPYHFDIFDFLKGDELRADGCPYILWNLHAHL